MQNIEFHGQIKDQSMQALRYEDGSHYVMKAIIQTLVNKGYTSSKLSSGYNHGTYVTAMMQV